jgi:hypothetical protein
VNELAPVVCTPEIESEVILAFNETLKTVPLFKSIPNSPALIVGVTVASDNVLIPNKVLDQFDIIFSY